MFFNCTKLLGFKKITKKLKWIEIQVEFISSTFSFSYYQLKYLIEYEKAAKNAFLRLFFPWKKNWHTRTLNSLTDLLLKLRLGLHIYAVRMRRKNACLHVGICISTVNMARESDVSPYTVHPLRRLFAATSSQGHVSLGKCLPSLRVSIIQRIFIRIRATLRAAPGRRIASDNGLT